MTVIFKIEKYKNKLKKWINMTEELQEYLKNDDALKVLSKVCIFELNKLNKLMFCYFCKKTKSTLWRSGPNGYRTLCNACGIKYARDRKRKIR